MFPTIVKYLTLAAAIFIAAAIALRFAGLLAGPGPKRRLRPRTEAEPEDGGEEGWQDSGDGRAAGRFGDAEGGQDSGKDGGQSGGEGCAAWRSGDENCEHSGIGAAWSAAHRAARHAARLAKRLWRGFAGSPELQIVALALGTRLLLYLLGYLSARLFQNCGDSFFQIFAELWQRSDAPHYLDIAEEWYVNAGEDRVFLVFLPLYPALVRALALFFGGDTLFAGLALSIGAFAAAAVVIYKTAPLVRRDAPCGATGTGMEAEGEATELSAGIGSPNGHSAGTGDAAGTGAAGATAGRGVAKSALAERVAGVAEDMGEEAAKKGIATYGIASAAGGPSPCEPTSEAVRPVPCEPAAGELAYGAPETSGLAPDAPTTDGFAQGKLAAGGPSPCEPTSEAVRPAPCEPAAGELAYGAPETGGLAPDAPAAGELAAGGLAADDGPFLSAKYLIFFPASFFVNGTFTESLFLLLSALFFRFMLRRRWAACGLMAMLAALTRYYGALLAIPLAIELVLDAAREWRSAPRNGEAGLLRFLAGSGFGRRAAAVLMAPLGTGLYLLLNYAVSGNAFQFLVYQREHWNQTFGLFYENLGNLAANMLQWQPSDSAALFAPQLAMAAFCVALIAYGIVKKFRVSMLAYLAAYFLVSVSASWMLSLPRYMFGAVPVYWLLADAGRRRPAMDALITFSLVCGLVYYMLAYVNGYYVY